MQPPESRTASSPWSCRPCRGAPSQSGESDLGQRVELSRAPGEALSVGCPTEAEVRLEAASEVVLVGPANRLPGLPSSIHRRAKASRAAVSTRRLARYAIGGRPVEGLKIRKLDEQPRRGIVRGLSWARTNGWS